MGLWRGDEYYTQRYEYALDYVQILRALWKDGRVTHRSRFFELDDCSCLPTPAHEIPIVSAGQSSAGRQFVAQIGGYSFAMVAAERLHGLAADLRQQAIGQGTRVGTYALFHLVAEETDELAWQRARAIAEAGDLEAIQNVVRSANLDSVKDGTTGQLRESATTDTGLLAGDIETSNLAFMGCPALVGSYETVARKIDAIAEDPDIEGLLFSWPEWVAGIRNFGERIIPLLACRRGWDTATMGGLRGSGRPAPGA
jgi:pyrimidine oxygenase